MFGYRPWEIERLTDLQIDELILGPELKRAAAAKGDGLGWAPGSFDDAPRDLESVPPEEVFVKDWTKKFPGTTEEYWRGQYRMNYGDKNAG